MKKYCSCCQKRLPETDFFKDKHTNDGLRYWCKKCSNAVVKRKRIRDREIVRKYKEGILVYKSK
jgi:hypothetical protein